MCEEGRRSRGRGTARLIEVGSDSSYQMELKSSLVVVETEGEVFEELSKDGRTRRAKRTRRIVRTDWA
jgi:hypothetical protein